MNDLSDGLFINNFIWNINDKSNEFMLFSKSNKNMKLSRTIEHLKRKMAVETSTNAWMLYRAL